MGAALMITAVAGDASRVGAVAAAVLFLVTYKPIGWRVGIGPVRTMTGVTGT